MASTGSLDSINDRAAEWAVETAFGQMTPQAQTELERWLAADRRHRGAYARACAWLQATEEAVTGGTAEANRKLAAPPARSAPMSDNDNGRTQASTLVTLKGQFSNWIGKGAAAGAALAASMAVLMALGIQPLSIISHGEPAAATRIVELRDGSLATLGPDAEIQVVLTKDVRRIVLLQGEATFKVAKDRARPFVVRSGGIYAQATGTVYSVSRVGLTGGAVEVREGSVLVWPRDERDQAVLLHAGGSVTLDPGTQSTSVNSKPMSSVPTRLPPPEVAQISLDNVPISTAVARFNRVNTRKIVLADPEVGAVKIIGLYEANDPDQFAHAAAVIAGANVEYRERDIVISMKEN